MDTEKAIPTIHIEGKLLRDEDWVYIDLGFGSLAETIEEKIKQVVANLNINIPFSKKDCASYEGYNECAEVSMFINRVFFRAYFSNEKCTLEEAEKGFITYMLGGTGSMDVLQEWYGYSEWTILGYDITNFKLISEDGGEHNLAQIFENYANKYVHIVIDILEI